MVRTMTLTSTCVVAVHILIFSGALVVGILLPRLKKIRTLWRETVRTSMSERISFRINLEAVARAGRPWITGLLRIRPFVLEMSA